MIVFPFHLYSGFTIGCNHARSRLAVSYKSSEMRTPSTKTWQWQHGHSKHSRTSNGNHRKQSRYLQWDASKRKGCVRKMSSRMVSSCEEVNHPLNPPILISATRRPLRVVVEKEELVILWRRGKPQPRCCWVPRWLHILQCERLVSAQHRQVVVIIWTSHSTKLTLISQSWSNTSLNPTESSTNFPISNRCSSYRNTSLLFLRASGNRNVWRSNSVEMAFRSPYL